MEFSVMTMWITENLHSYSRFFPHVVNRVFGSYTPIICADWVGDHYSKMAFIAVLKRTNLKNKGEAGREQEAATYSSDSLQEE